MQIWLLHVVVQLKIFNHTEGFITPEFSDRDFQKWQWIKKSFDVIKDLKLNNHM